MLLWWTLGYLAMDSAYVFASRGTYMRSVADVAGSTPKDITKVIVCAIGAYALMALGWSSIVVPAITKKGRAWSGARAGGLYGLVLYGVFNFTTGAMFDAWSWAIIARDTLWGTMSLAAWTALYGWGTP
jgi:uncharacterized membrane protein